MAIRAIFASEAPQQRLRRRQASLNAARRRADTRRVPKRRTLADLARIEALDPGVRIALEALGYEIVSASAPASKRPDLRIVDEAGLARIPRDEATAGVPIILLRSPRSAAPPDPRIVASLAPPASLQDLYAALQCALERKPRHSPRVATGLSGRCWHDTDFWTGDVLSLSESGCLFRGPRTFPLDLEVTVLFSLPDDEVVSSEARPTRRTGEDVGLEFLRLDRESLAAISRYVMGRLTAARTRSNGQGI